MEHCIGTKQLLAKRMTLGDYNKYQGWVMPKDQDPDKEGYLVEYLDGGPSNHENHEGYISWSPKEVFEAAYESVNKMSFSSALILLKEGKKVARKGWNGSGMYVVKMDGYPEGVMANAETSAKHDIPLGTPVVVLPYFTLKTASGAISTWVASSTDLAAEDWMLVE